MIKELPACPVETTLSLIETGLSLKPILDAMWDWGINYKKSYEEDNA